MNYNELSDKDKIRLILQHVMGCWVTEITARGYHDPELPKGRELAALGFHWPLAYWNTDGEGWMIKDIATDAEFFDPLHDFNDAWIVVERIQDANIHICNAPRSEYVRCAVERYDETTPYFVLGQKAPYVICQAILFSKGVIDADGNVIEASE